MNTFSLREAWDLRAFEFGISFFISLFCVCVFFCVKKKP